MNTETKLRENIHAYSFAIHEMKLYLDVHPDNQHVIEMIKKYREGRKAAIEEYEKVCGKYIETSADVKPVNHWSWIDDPWPWEYKEDKK